MSPYLIIVGLPIACGIVGLVHVWRAPRYVAKPMPNMEWRTEKPRQEFVQEQTEVAA